MEAAWLSVQATTTIHKDQIVNTLKRSKKNLFRHFYMIPPDHSRKGAMSWAYKSAQRARRDASTAGTVYSFIRFLPPNHLSWVQKYLFHLLLHPIFTGPILIYKQYSDMMHSHPRQGKQELSWSSQDMSCISGTVMLTNTLWKTRPVPRGEDDGHFQRASCKPRQD